MKKLLNLSFLVLFLLASATVFAQQPVKLGHIDTNELLRLMPGRDSAQVQLERYARELEDQFTTMQNELQTKYQNYLENESTFSELIRQSRQRELTNLQERIQEFQASAQQDLVDQENKLLSPIIEQAQTAIGDVAEEHGFTYVFDISAGSLLYWEKGENILPLVRAKLGL
ncbi:MAG: OmpH family outer membrane protein [Bacteroidales bacterium]